MVNMVLVAEYAFCRSISMTIYIMLSRFDLAKITRQSSDGGAADMSMGVLFNLGPFRHETLNRAGLGPKLYSSGFQTKPSQSNSEEALFMLMAHPPFIY